MGLRVCPNCGKTIDDTFEQCIYCNAIFTCLKDEEKPDWVTELDTKHYSRLAKYRIAATIFACVGLVMIIPAGTIFVNFADIQYFWLFFAFTCAALLPFLISALLFLSYITIESEILKCIKIDNHVIAYAYQTRGAKVFIDNKLTASSPVEKMIDVAVGEKNITIKPFRTKYNKRDVLFIFK